MHSVSEKPNRAIDLYRAWSKRFTANKQPLEPNDREKTVLALLDHFNELHFHDRADIRRELKAHAASRRLHREPPDDA